MDPFNPYNNAQAYIQQRRAGSYNPFGGSPEIGPGARPQAPPGLNNPFSPGQMDVLRHDPRANIPYNPVDQGAPESAFAPMGPGYNPGGSGPLTVDVRKPPPRPKVTDYGNAGSYANKPQGKITQDPGAIAPNAMHPLSGTSTNPVIGNGGGNSDNPWVNPLSLAQQDGSNTRYLGPGGQSSNASGVPGDGLWSFLGSGAPQAFQSGGGGLQGPTPNGPSLDTVANGSGGLYSPADKIGAALGVGGKLGERGSFMNVLSGGAPSQGSAAEGLGKFFSLFGGGGF